MTTVPSDFVLDFLDFIWKFVFVSLIFFSSFSLIVAHSSIYYRLEIPFLNKRHVQKEL